MTFAGKWLSKIYSLSTCIIVEKKMQKNPTLYLDTSQRLYWYDNLMRFKNIAEKAETHINKLSPTKVLPYFGP
jgi:hypothetical protein